MKKSLSVLCLLALALSFALPAVAAEHELNFTTPYFDRHPTVINGFKPWIEEIFKKTGGKVGITYFAPNTICPEAEITDSVAQGTVDMGGNTFGRNAGRLLITEMGQLPMTNRSPRTTAMAWYDVTQKFPQLFPEFQKDVKLLFCWSSALVQLHTTKKPVRKMEDLKGLKIIAWNSTTLEYIRLLGGTPMLQSNADTYLALERGMADGVMAPVAPLRSQKLTDILRYHTICDISLSVFWGGMNMKTYSDLPADIRKVFDETTGVEFSGKIAQTLEDGANADMEWIRQQGKAEIITLDSAELARWKKALEPVMDISLKKLAAGGISEKDGRDVYNYYMERLVHYNAQK